ncbi:MAG: SGNH/GDSL hydrolase family protein [Gemmatimonadaceae bacterium]
MIEAFTRRDFFRISVTSAAGLACASRMPANALAPTIAGRVVLFQGDSITDAGRDRRITAANVALALGTGYPLLIASRLLRAEPERNWQFFNRGVSGDKVPDLQARWSADTIALRPDILSVLVGVNDFWHKRLKGYTGTTADYESEYVATLTTTRRVFPALRLVVLEPFVLRYRSVDATWFPDFDERRAAAARVASRVGATFVQLQDAFNAASARTGPAYWTADGIHPTPAGHALIAERWCAAVEM